MQSFIDVAVRLLNMRITLEGFTFSFLQILMFLVVLGLLCLFLKGVLR